MLRAEQSFQRSAFEFPAWRAAILITLRYSEYARPQVERWSLGDIAGSFSHRISLLQREYMCPTYGYRSCDMYNSRWIKLVKCVRALVSDITRSWPRTQPNLFLLTQKRPFRFFRACPMSDNRPSDFRFTGESLVSSVD